ncbi:MAG TPA: HXXEE domain-containing protein [Bacillales bacterium]|nr:HXXEE domain-containing protein [Bacillales bacterium]
MFDIQTVIWLFPVIFMFHDLEEIITIEGFMGKYKKAPKNLLARLVLLIKKKLGAKSSQLAVAVAWMLLIISFVTFTTANLPDSVGSFLVFTAVLNVFFVQVFFHIAQTIILGSYTPGIITAVCLVVPYSLFAYYHLLEADFIDWHMIVESIPFSLLLVPIFLVGNLLGRQFIR